MYVKQCAPFNLFIGEKKILLMLDCHLIQVVEDTINIGAGTTSTLKGQVCAVLTLSFVSMRCP